MGNCCRGQEVFTNETLENIRKSGKTLYDSDGVKIDESVIKMTLVGIYNRVPLDWYSGLRCQPGHLQQFLPSWFD